MSLVMSATLIMVLAALLDRVFGEPRRWHPLVGFGWLAQQVEARWNCARFSPRVRRLNGVLALSLVVAPFVMGALLAVHYTAYGFVIAVLLLYLALGAQSLAEHARRVQQALDTQDLPLARTRVSYLVSRDSAAMTSPDVARAAVESVLENGNDAVFGALFWFVVAGAPGVVLYRLVNTLDAMWGYRTPQYADFGWTAARLDDLLNFIPARLTACSYAVLGQCARALRCWREQARAWESPNAGPVMAAGAGALGLQLGGPAMYHGALKARPVLGAGAAPNSVDIARALRLVNQSIVLWLAVIALSEWLLA